MCFYAKKPFPESHAGGECTDPSHGSLSLMGKVAETNVGLCINAGQPGIMSIDEAY